MQPVPHGHSKRPGLAIPTGLGPLLGRSQAMRQVYEQITRVARTAMPVFITGESGTGKELAARCVHDLGSRRQQPFLAVNCGAIAPQLIESEVFGHERGSFTGAERQHQGFFEQAHGGTLFLDEVTEMQPALQVKLLRVLESGSFMRVGSTRMQTCDVRIIAASNRNLVEAVATGALREDLFYRLLVFPIELPPLRERREDIPLLADHLMQQINQGEGMTRCLTPTGLQQLVAYHWPGNVRQLRHVLQRAWVMSEGTLLDETWLRCDDLRSPARTSPLHPAAAGTTLAAMERQLVLSTLAQCDHHKELTAATLGISLRTLYNKLKAYGL